MPLQSPQSSSCGHYDSEFEPLGENLPVSPSEASFEGFVETGELSGQRRHHLSSVSRPNGYFFSLEIVVLQIIHQNQVFQIDPF